jgi:hypothetical protein
MFVKPWLMLLRGGPTLANGGGKTEEPKGNGEKVF